MTPFDGRLRTARNTILAALWVGVMAGASSAAETHESLESRWGAILDRYAHDVDDTAETRVNYRGLADEPDWKTLLRELADAPPPRSRAEVLAFWTNAYNILAIDVVLRHYPVKSIRDIGSFFTPVWDRPAGRAAGRDVTLGEIEHQILRPLGEPRIHAAIVCASTSCPALSLSPYTASRIDAQLGAALERFLANPDKGLRVERDAGRVRLSSIFDWFDDDFDVMGGVLTAVRAHAPKPARAWLGENERPRVAYFDYDWSLNDWRGPAASAP